MKCIRVLFFVFSFIFLVSSSGLADEVEDLKREMAEMKEKMRSLEEKIAEIQVKKRAPLASSDLEEKVTTLEADVLDLTIGAAKREPVRTFISEKFNLGGYLSSALTTFFGKGQENQWSFTELHLDLQASADITEKLHLFTDIRLEYESHTENEDTAEREFEERETGAELEIGWVEYKFSDYFTLQGGRLVTPFGIINIEHFEPLLIQHDKPQFLRHLPGEDNIILFDYYVTGVQGYGIFPIQNHKLGYHIYGNTPKTDTNNLGGGGRLFWSFPGELVTLGISNQSGRREDGTYSTLGLDSFIHYKNFTLRSEYAKGFFEGAENPYAFYLQPSIRFGKLVPFYQIDYLDDPLNLTEEEVDPIEKIEHTIGINYLPWEFLRLRLEFTVHDYRGDNDHFEGEDRDYYSSQASTTVSW